MIKATFRTISALAAVFALAASALAAPADTVKSAPALDPAAVLAPYAVPPGLAVPKVPDEKGRVIVADTLKFKWPPDTASAKALPKASVPVDAPSKKAVLVDTAASKIIPVDTSSSKVMLVDTASSSIIAIDTSAKAAEPSVKRPRTRQELNKMSREDLFRLAFGRAAPEKPRSLAVRLFGDGRLAGNTEINYNENFTAFTFRSMALSRLLDRVILPEARDAAGDSMGRFDSGVLEEAGYRLVVDDERFELRIAFPPGDKRVQFTSVYGGGQREEPRGEEIRPAGVSFYLNYSADKRARLRRFGSGEGVLTNDPALVDAEGALSAGGWVFESSGWVREPYEGRPFTWENARRDDARAVRDFADLSSRLSIGDVSYGTSILPGSMSGGARYERNSYFFGKDPYDDLNSVTFFMAAPGEAEVYMDGAFRRRLYLPAGRHQVGGFGGSAGRNRVRLLLRSESGSSEEIPFEFVLSEPRIMARGDVRYALSAGVRREYAPSPACFYYYLNEPVVSADYAYGIHHAVNAGVSAAAARRAAQGGAQVSFGLGGIGFVDMRGIASYRVEDAIGGEAAKNVVGGRAEGSYTADFRRPAARFNRFVTGDPNKVFLPEITFAARGYYQTPFYSQRLFNESSGGIEGGMAGLSGDLSVPVWRGSVSAFAGANFYRETGLEVEFYPYDYEYGVRFSQSFGRSYFTAGAGESVRGPRRLPYFTMNTSHAFGTDVRAGNHRFSASAGAGMSSRYVPAAWDGSAEEADESVEFDWSYGGLLGWGWSNNSGTRDYAANVTLVNDQPLSGNAALRHTYNRAQLNAGYDVTFDDYAYDPQNHSLRAQLSGSFMYADGLWAFGRRVSGGGFALIAPVGDLSGAAVHINRSRSSGGGLSRSGLLGAAYHNRLAAYAPAEMTLSLTDVPIGAFLEQNRYYAVGGYKQGFALRVGKRAQVIAVVPFVEKRGGRPLGHTYLTIEPETEDEDGPAQPRPTFTSEDGVLQIGGLTPGRGYRIKFRASSGFKETRIEIPEDARKVYIHPEVAVDRED